MDPDAERAAAYLLRATQLLELAATLRDDKSRQFMIETARYYERLAAALIPDFRSESSD